MSHPDSEPRQRRPRSSADSSPPAAQPYLGGMDLLRHFFDSLPVPAFSITPEGNIRLCNPAALSLLGYEDSASLSGKPLVSTVYAPSCRKKAERLFASWRRGGSIRGDELEVLTRHGEIRDVIVYVDSILSRDGKRRYSLALNLDITERKEVEQRLRREQERSRMYLDMAGAVLVALDRHGIVTLINPAGSAVLEAQEEDILGKNWFETFVPKDKRQEVRRVFDRLMDRLTKNVEYAENEVLTGKGNIRVVAWHNTPILDEDGAILGTFSSGVDITEHRAADIALAESERHYHELADSLPQVVYEMDAKGRLLFVNSNAFRVFGYSQKDFERGLNALDMIAPEDRKRAARNITHALQDASRNGTEYTAVRKNGERFPVLIHSSQIVRQGKIAGLRGLIIDLTEQKATERALRESDERLRQSQKMESLGKLAGGVAHDFNNLLTTILGYSELLLVDSALPGQAREYIGEILSSAQRAASLVNQLLAFSRKQVLHPVPIDLNELIADLTRMLQRLIQENIRLETDLDPDIEPIKADPAQLEQVIINLATNARDAMPSGGELTISTRRASVRSADRNRFPGIPRGRYVRLSVSDTGQGMDEKTMAKLFEPFFTTKEVGRGTGLGLASVFGTVQQSNGYIYVDSKPGRGSTFSIYLPEHEETGEQASAVNATTGNKGTGESILLVEDDRALRTMTERILEAAGYRVHPAANGREARDLLHSGGIPFVDLLLTDMVMPEMGGKQLTEIVRGRYPDLKVLYMSGHSEEAALLQDDPGSQIGFIEKPFTPASMAEKVRRVLDWG
jgi:two-component system cell cycle sensor histidine kinase/response regulator CckA